MRPARLRLAGQVLAVALVAALLGLLGWKLVKGTDGGAAAQLAAGKRPAAPAFTLSRLDTAGELSLASLRGKVVVLNFWASWCLPCKAEAPRLQKAWESRRADGVVFLGVDAQDFRSDARRFMKRFGITYPVVYDGQGSTLGHYGVTGFPETYFVARDGKLAGERVQGEISDEELERGIEAALAASP